MFMTVQSIPAPEGVRKVGPHEGERFDIAGAHLTWKIKSEDSSYAFTVCEQALAPGEGVPLHCHPSPEAFYVIEGQVDFLRFVGGMQDWIRCEAGSTMILPPNSLHAFCNRFVVPCRLLGISTQLHQTFFDAIADADRKQPFSAHPNSEALERIAEIGLQCNMYFVPFDMNMSDDPAVSSIHER
jgi:quercetin dioxygenase-like cupin family protein